MGSGKSKPTAKAPAAASTSTPSRGQTVAQVIEHKQVVLPAPDSGGKQSFVSRNSPAPAAREAGDTALLFESFRQVREPLCLTRIILICLPLFAIFLPATHLKTQLKS